MVFPDDQDPSTSADTSEDDDYYPPQTQAEQLRALGTMPNPTLPVGEIAASGVEDDYVTEIMGAAAPRKRGHSMEDVATVIFPDVVAYVWSLISEWAQTNVKVDNTGSPLTLEALLAPTAARLRSQLPTSVRGLFDAASTYGLYTAAVSVTNERAARVPEFLRVVARPKAMPPKFSTPLMKERASGKDTWPMRIPTKGAVLMCVLAESTFVQRLATRTRTDAFEPIPTPPEGPRQVPTMGGGTIPDIGGFTRDLADALNLTTIEGA